jgi:hypothetical protein
MKKFGTIEEYEAYYFPKDVAARRDRRLREEDPEEWQRQQREKAINDLMKKVFG